MGNVQRYVKIMIDVDSKDEQCCHRFCGFHWLDNYCLLFKQYRKTMQCDMPSNEFTTYVRLPECIKKQTN